MSGDSNDKSKSNTTFTVDAETTSNNVMPSLTRLLNRKKFAKPATSEPTSSSPKPSSVANPADKTVAMPMPETPDSIDLSAPPEAVLVESSAGPKKSVQAAPKPARRRQHAGERPLVAWTPAALKSGDDPLGQALVKLLGAGVSQALFLAIQPVAGSTTPVFVATAAVNAGPKAPLWAGLRWDPTVLPDMWQQLVSTGYVELPPPGTMTNLQSARNVSRAAFDVGNEDSLVLARVGTAQQCRGIVVLVSRKSLIAAVKQIMPLLTAMPQKAAA